MELGAFPTSADMNRQVEIYNFNVGERLSGQQNKSSFIAPCYVHSISQ